MKMKKMMMNKTIVAIAIGAVSIAAMAEATAPKRGRPRGSRPSGGIVEKAYSGNVLKVVDAQKSVPRGRISDMVREARYATLLPIEAVDGEVKPTLEALVAKAQETVNSDKTGAAVLIIDDAALPFRIFSDESNWAILNLAFLHEGEPKPEVFETRVEKMLWRTLARALQVGSVANTPSVLQPFKTLKELDANTATRPSPEGYNAFIDNAKAYGIGTISIASYRDACHKGWAPYPTNEVQKAIWDEIRQLPSKPIKIEFDPKRGK